MLFSDAITEYMADKGKRLRATTLEGYRSAIRCHLMPQWSKREIETISFEEVQDWVDSFALPGAAEKAYKTFRQIYRWVLRRHQLRIWDVTQGVELPKKPTARRPTLTAEQERVTLKAIVGQPFEAAVLLGAALGLRRCEACAVRIEDVDWRSGWVHVQRGLHVVGGEVIETGCKTRLSDRRSNCRALRWSACVPSVGRAGLVACACLTPTPSPASSACSASGSTCRMSP